MPFGSSYPRPGWVEQDAMEIWQRPIVRRCAFSNREAWNGSTSPPAGSPTSARPPSCGIAGPACLSRPPSSGNAAGPPICVRNLPALERRGLIERKTGLVIDAYFSASKIRWILENVPDARAKARNGEILFGTIDTWLIWNLTAGPAHVTDLTNASRTMLMDLATASGTTNCLRVFDIPRAMLPDIAPSSGRVGTIAVRQSSALKFPSAA